MKIFKEPKKIWLPKLGVYAYEVYSIFGVNNTEYQKFKENPKSAELTSEMMDKMIKDLQERLNK